MFNIGFIGTGTLIEAIVKGFNRFSQDNMKIVVSPRSEKVSESLTRTFSNVSRALDNQSVVSTSDVVFLGFKPDQLGIALDGLEFRSEQIIVSLIAGVPLAEIETAVGPKLRVHRLMTIPSVMFHKAPLICFPCEPSLAGILGNLGRLLVAEDEDELVVLLNTTALMSAYFEMQQVVFRWLCARGIRGSLATDYVTSMFDGLGALAVTSIHAGRPVDPKHLETREGLNAFGRELLQSAGCSMRSRGPSMPSAIVRPAYELAQHEHTGGFQKAFVRRLRLLAPLTERAAGPGTASRASASSSTKRARWRPRSTRRRG